MPRIPIQGFIGPAYESRSKIIDCQQCINLYPEIETANSKNVVALIGTPGLIRFSTQERAGHFRGCYTSSTDKMYAVFGSNLYEYDTDGVSTLIGSLLTNTTQVKMVDNGPANIYGGDQLFVCDGTYGYIVTMSTGAFARITNAGFQGAADVVFKDAYFLAIKPNTQEVWQSGVYDGTSWDGLTYATAEGTGDLLVRIEKTNNELLLFGKKSIEIWANNGLPGFSFGRINGAFIDFGTDAANSIAVNGNNCFFLGSNNNGNGVVWHLNAYTPQRISTHAIEYAISQMARIDDAIGYCYQQEGHFFYVINFPAGKRTFVYDLTTGLWHERVSYKKSSGETSRHKGTGHTYFDGKHIVGDYYRDGHLYYLDLDAYTDGEEPIVRVRTCPHVHSQNKRIYINRIEIDMEKGVGIPSGQGSDPQAMLQISKDGGKTWSAERWQTIGRQGEYLTRMQWNRLGMGRDIVIRLMISDPIPVRIINAFMDYEVESD